MWWAPIAAAGVSAIGNLLSSRMGGGAEMAPGWDERMYLSSQEAQRAEAASQQIANQSFAQNAALQREFAQMGVRWRVEDAKAAGLHPLFALGGQLPPASPIPVMAQSFQGSGPEAPVAKRGGSVNWGAMGQDISRAVMAAMDTNARRLQEAQLRSAEARAEGDELQVAALRNEVARKAQEAYQATPIENMRPNEFGVRVKAVQAPDAPQGFALPDFTVNEKMFAKAADPSPHVVEGPAVRFWQPHQMASNFQMLLPKTSEPQEVFEDKPAWFWMAVIQGNVKQYGAGWLRGAKDMFPSGSTIARTLDMVAKGGADAIDHMIRMPNITFEDGGKKLFDWGRRKGYW